MSDLESTVGAPVVAGESKKRKRTGKDRKEAKALAEQAQARMAELIASAKESEPVPAPVIAQTKVETGAAEAAKELKAQADAAAAAAFAAAAAAKREPESIAGRIPQGLKAIHPLLKQARTFETQRLIKKVRWSRSKEEDVTDMEAQIAALSDLDLHDLAITHLRQKLSKHHLFKHNPLPSPISSALESPSAPSSAESSTSALAAQKAKAENRLVSAKLVADGMKDILAWVAGEPGARLVSRPMAAKKEKERKKGKGMDEGRKRMLEAVQDSDENDDDEGSEGDDEGEEGMRGIMIGSGSEGEESDGDVDEEGMAADAAGWESGSVDDLDLGDGEEEEDSGDQTDDPGAIVPAKRSKPTPSSSTKSKSTPTKAKAVPIEKKAEATKPTKPAKPEKAPKAKPQKREDITSSLFLPSLAAGFTRGDSDDSDPDMDFDADGSGMIGKQGAERKNRRGQRARQAIWEKKYGKNAKHVVKSREADNVAQAENNIKNAYGKRAAAVGGESATPAAAGGRTVGRPAATAAAVRPTTTYTPKSAPAAVSASAPAPVSAPAAGGGQGLHPSWEAARRKKAMLAAAPAAQKIVFD